MRLDNSVNVNPFINRRSYKHSNLNGKESWFNFIFMSCILKTITNLQSVRMNIKVKSQLMN